MIKYLIKTENEVYECEDFEVLDKKTSALKLLGFDFDIYELTKVNSLDL